jgi:uncharacterized protein
MNDGWLVSLLPRFRGPQGRASVVMLVSLLLLITWWYFGSPDFYHKHLAGRLTLWNDPALTAGAYLFAATFVLFGLVPALIVKLVFRERLADYGVRLGNVPLTCRSLLILVPIMLSIAWLSARDPAVRAYYPLNRSAGLSPGMFGFHAATYLLFYLGWEFHFRGFLQHGLRETMGDWQAILVQIAASTLAHLGRPAAETYAAIGAGLLWGVLAFRTRSLLSGLLQHALLGIALDYFICLSK